jgi:hypothetical protein
MQFQDTLVIKCIINKGINLIRKCRKANRKNGYYIFLMMLMGSLVGFVFPQAILITIIGICLFWYSFWKTAKAACSGCGEIFATNWFIPLGIGTDNFQYCRLGMKILEKKEAKVPRSHDRNGLNSQCVTSGSCATFHRCAPHAPHPKRKALSSPIHVLN